MLKSKNKEKILPELIWVLSLYFIEGLPYALVNNVSVVLFKTLEVSNSQIGLFTSLFYIPWAIKFFWAPIVDYYSKHRNWLIFMQIVLAILCAVLAFSVSLLPSITLLCGIFTFIAFASATYDIACDGYYLDSLPVAKQSLYIGWRNTAYKMAWLFASGFLVFAAGQLVTGILLNNVNNTNQAWGIVFSGVALLFAVGSVFHNFILPLSKAQRLDANSSEVIEKTTLLGGTFKAAFQSFFAQQNIGLVLLWILFFRAGDAMLLKMAQPFLLDQKERGGLGLSLQNVGAIYGSLGMICLLVGGLAGGWVIFRYGLKKCLLPLAFIQSLMLPLYWFLAVFKPDISFIALANGIEQFVYGLATAAYTNYLFTLTKEKFVASHYAIATGFMAIGMIIPGIISGYLVDIAGYEKFFLFSFLASIPGLILTYKLPHAYMTTVDD